MRRGRDRRATYAARRMEEIDPQRYVLPALLAVLFLGAFLILVTSGGSDEPAGAVDRPARSTTTTKQKRRHHARRQPDRVADPERGEALRQGPGRRHPDVDRRVGGHHRRPAARDQPQRRSRLAEARADAQARTVTARVARLLAVLALLLLSPGAAAQSPSGAPRLVGRQGGDPHGGLDRRHPAVARPQPAPPDRLDDEAHDRPRRARARRPRRRLQRRRLPTRPRPSRRSACAAASG